MSDSDAESTRATLPVDDAIFRQVYDSPSSLPGSFRWVTPDGDVREIEQLLGMPPETIGAPLWISADSESCAGCGRRFSWLDIVSSGLHEHGPEMVARVILGTQKFVNIDAPHAIPGLVCYSCGAKLPDVRSFKCHNWAYAMGQLEELVRQLEHRHS